MVKNQRENIANMVKQLEKASSQVQDIAVKAVTGSAQTKLLEDLIKEKPKKGTEDKGDK